jgi:3-oxoacyl-[acyl-carrier protein] reductase
MPDHKGPVTLITGAASGIGAATARLLSPGSRLALHTRGGETKTRDRLQSLADTLRANGSDVETLFGDLAEAGCGGNLVAACVSRFGQLDQIVANAGFADKRATADLTRADLDRSYATMTAAFFEMAQAAAPRLADSSQGRIVVVSSFVAHRFRAGSVFVASAVAKAGAEALMRALAAEMAAHGVTVNAVVPGYTKKDGGHSALSPDAWTAAIGATPLGRIGEPEDVAHLIRFLLSPEASHITGQAIAVDGGLSLG